MQRKGMGGGNKPTETVSRFECSARVESQPLSDDDDSVVVLLTPDLNGKAFVPRRFELTEGQEVQVKVSSKGSTIKFLPVKDACFQK